MFFSLIFIFYVVLNLYVYIRIRTILWSKEQRIVFTLVFSLLVAAFLVAETLSHATDSPSVDLILTLGYLSLPFLLYLFLFVLLLDILKLINKVLRIVSVESLQSHRFRIITLCVLIAVPALIVTGGRYWFSDIKINNYHVEISRKASPLRHLKIAVASDFHLKKMTDGRFLPRFAAMVNQLDADILLIPGDVLEGDRQDGQLSSFEFAFRQIRTRYGVYASLGNHEFYGRRGRLGFFSQSNITVLQDSVAVIDRAFTLVGRHDNHFAQRKPIAELIKSAPDSLPVIVLDHRPVDLESISAANADIVVSGHTHHGQLFPFNLITNRIYEVSWGYAKKKNTHVFVTSGIQVWGPPVRTAGDSEIIVIDVDLVDS